MSGFFKAPSADIIRASDDLMTFIGTRPDLSPETFYITASHLMQYVLPAAGMPEGRDFVRRSRELYRRFQKQILGCPAFPWKEKIVFLLFTCGWLYANHAIKRIGG